MATTDRRLAGLAVFLVCLSTCQCFIQTPTTLLSRSLAHSLTLRESRAALSTVQASQAEPEDSIGCEIGGLDRRRAVLFLGAGLLAAATPAAAYCPPNCRPDEGPAPIEGLAKPIDLDKSGKAKSLSAAAQRPASQPSDPDEVQIDLSTKEGQQLAKETDRAYFDLQFGENTNTSRIEIALYGDVVPQAHGRAIVQGLQVSAGDVLANQGRSGKSALNGGTFEQENFKIMHSVPYVVSMTNTLQKEVDSRFFISTRPEVDLGYSKIFDGKYVAFGRVVKGIETVVALDALETRSGKGVNSGRPKDKVLIKDCGILPK